MEKLQYVCPKCGCTQIESDQFQATGGNFAKLFDVQNRSSSPSAVSTAAIRACIRPRAPTGWNILDFLVGN